MTMQFSAQKAESLLDDAVYVGQVWLLVTLSEQAVDTLKHLIGAKAGIDDLAQHALHPSELCGRPFQKPASCGSFSHDRRQRLP